MAEISLEDAPRKARDLFDKGFAAMERGNLDYAMDMFMASLEIEPRLLHARKFLRAAEVKKFRDNKGGAFTHFITMLTGLPGYLNVMALAKKKPDQALKSAEKLMRRDALNMPFIKALGQAAVAAGMPEVAIQALEIAKDQYPKNIELLKWLGDLYLEVNNTHEARMCFEDIVRMRPNDPKYIKSLKDAAALDTMKQGGWETADTYRDVMKDTKEATTLEQEAKAVKSTGDIDALIRDTLAKVQREPDNVNYRRALAELYSRVERFDEALKILNDAQQTTGRADPQIDRAISSIRSRKFEYEIAALTKSGNTAEAEAKEREKFTFLLEDAAERVRRYPNDLQFRYELGVLLYERNNLNEAIQEFQQSQRNPQRRMRSLYYLALCFKQKKQYDIAMEQLEKAASEMHVMDDSKKDIVYEMGLISELMGHMDKAAAYYKEIYSVDIGYKDIAAKIEKAYKK